MKTKSLRFDKNKLETTKKVLQENRQLKKQLEILEFFGKIEFDPN
jgi:hypothetical protein